jgi:hypothetical protein
LLFKLNPEAHDGQLNSSLRLIFQWFTNSSKKVNLFISCRLIEGREIFGMSCPNDHLQDQDFGLPDAPYEKVLPSGTTVCPNAARSPRRSVPGSGRDSFFIAGGLRALGECRPEDFGKVEKVTPMQATQLNIPPPDHSDSFGNPFTEWNAHAPLIAQRSSDK